MRKLLLFVCVLLPIWAGAQSTSGNITASGSTCATTNACVTLNINPTTGAVVVTLSGTWVGTVQFEASNDGGVTSAAVNATPLNSATAVTSATGNGTWRINGAGLTNVWVRGSAYTSGTIAVRISAGSGSASTSSGGSGTVTNAASLTVNHVLLGAGGNAAAVDSALATDGAGALSGATSVTTTGGSADSYTCIAAPASPGAGLLFSWCDSTDLRFHDENASGTIGTTVVAGTCSTGAAVTGISAAGVTSCSPTPGWATLTDGATITWAIASAVNANATVTLGGNRTLNITGPLTQGNYVLRVVQDGTGSRGLTLGTGCTWKVSGGGAGAITPTTTAGAIDILAFSYDGTNCYATFGKNYT